MHKDPLRHERAASSSPDADREERIEQLLLAGLDEYFAGHYEQAINVWTRVAFLERGHGRARAYIERARSALAERQRETDELVHTGVVAYEAGDMAGARNLLTRALEHGPSDTALLFLQRVNRAEAAARLAPAIPARSVSAAASAATAAPRLRWFRTVAVSGAVASAILLPVLPVASWLADLPLEVRTIAVPTPEPLPIIRPSEVVIARARGLRQAGRQREALRMLEQIDLADPNRTHADRLRADLQRELLGVAGVHGSTRR